MNLSCHQYALAEIISVISCGVLFMIGLLTGVWKYYHIMNTPNHQAPIYVNIAHRAALMYAFACLILKEFVRWSTLSDTIEFFATGVPIFFFLTAVMTYIYLGFSNHTDNQFEKRNLITTWGMYFLILGEIGGFGTLLFSALKNITFNIL